MVCRCSRAGVCSGVQEMVPGGGRGTAESAGWCGGASVAQSSGGEHGSQAPAHTEHTVMVTLGLTPPRARAAVKHSRGPGCQALSEAVEVPGWRLVRVHVQCEGEGWSSGPAISCAAQPQPACGL